MCSTLLHLKHILRLIIYQTLYSTKCYYTRCRISDSAAVTYVLHENDSFGFEQLITLLSFNA